MHYGIAQKLIGREFLTALEQYKEFNSMHEGLAVLQEEYEELKAEVFKKPQRRNLEKITKEAIQLGAMAVRFLSDCC